jgi:tRNA-2-methylthio-N6-dimethylallyladenosine synthase
VASKYWIETYGCQMNVHDAERMAGLLEEAGYEPTAEADEADVVIINTCSVRERAEEKLFTRLGELRAAEAESGRRPIVAVTGCVAQQEGSSILRRSPLVDVIVGTQALRQLPLLVSRAEAVRPAPLVDINPYEDVSFPLGLTRRADPVKAYVTIIEGCNDFCSFCVVPYTRGKERMRPVAEVLAEVREAAEGGRREVHFLGQIVNHYQAPDDPACDFPELLTRAAAIPGVDRIRFASPHPRHVTPRLIATIRDVPQVCKHLHLPVQSGSTRVLGAMRRRHTREEYLDLVTSIREAVPGIALSTDLIVGFPGEADEDFSATLSLVAQVRYHSLFSFKYSPRPSTLAAKRLPDDVPEVEKTRRIVELQSLQRRIQTELHEAAIGCEVEVLVDATSRRRSHELSGRTGGNTVVNFPGEPAWIGRLSRVRIERAGPNSLWGRSLEVEPSWAVAPDQAGASSHAD